MDSAGYVFYGDKAMTLASFEKLQLFKGVKLKPLYEIGMSLCYAYHPINQVCVKGWNLWNKKFAHLDSEIVFKTCPSPFNKASTYIFIISKGNFLKVVQDNEGVFRERLSSYTNAEELLHNCIASKNMMKETLQDDEVVLGVLLGYGRNNAELFEKRTVLTKRMDGLTENDPEYLKVKEELNSLANQTQYSSPMSYYNLQNCSPEKLLQFLPLPQFVADGSTKETQELQKSYEATREKIQALYKGKNFVDETLAQLFPNM